MLPKKIGNSEDCEVVVLIVPGSYFGEEVERVRIQSESKGSGSFSPGVSPMPSLNEGEVTPISSLKIADRHILRVQEDLWAESLRMASIVEAAFAKSVRALCDGRPDLAAEVKAHEKDIDRREVAIESECLRVLALYEPVACDLRRVLTILRINRDLERIGDLSARIAKRVRRMAKEDGPIPISEPLEALANGAATAIARRPLDAPGTVRRRGGPVDPVPRIARSISSVGPS